MRQNAYQVLDQTIEDALNQRSPDFTGVMTCTPADSLASILAYVRDRRCHRFVIVEPEDVPARDGMPARKKGSLVGLLSLSDVLRFIVGHENLKGMEVPGLGEFSPLRLRAAVVSLADQDGVSLTHQACTAYAVFSNPPLREVALAGSMPTRSISTMTPRP